MIQFITSLNQKLFASYGRHFIESWRLCAKDDVTLAVYCEGGVNWFPSELLSERISAIEIESDPYENFRTVYGRFLEANGRVPYRVANVPDQYVFKYNYRFDALRFCFKAFSYLKAIQLESDECQFMAWIDADVVCKKPFGISEISALLPNNGEIASYLGRTAFPPQAPHSECGFVGYNLNVPSTRAFLSDFIREYTTGAVFQNNEWHDSYIFDQIRLRYESRGHKFLNLSGVHHAQEHPFVLSPLGKYFDHLKGPARKVAGHS